MRGVAGMLFVFLGLVMGYMILSGKFPSSSPIVNTPPPVVNPVGINQRRLNNGTGSGPTGLPTMSYFHDLVASRGGMQ